MQFDEERHLKRLTVMFATFMLTACDSPVKLEEVLSKDKPVAELARKYEEQGLLESDNKWFGLTVKDISAFSINKNTKKALDFNLGFSAETEEMDIREAVDKYCGTSYRDWRRVENTKLKLLTAGINTSECKADYFFLADSNPPEWRVVVRLPKNM